MSTLYNGVISQPVILNGTTFSEYINLNTLFAAVVVLAILVLIMLITYFVNIKPNLNKSENKQSKNSSVDNAIAQIVVNEEENLIGDYELVAVITAAIYASMGDAVPANGLVVRSIRKANSRRWINA